MRAIALLAAALVFAAALAPIDLGALPLGDKALHVLAFAFLGGLAVRAKWRAIVVTPALLAFAILIELAQVSLTPDRVASAVDAVASAMGAGLGLFLGKLNGARLLAGASFCVAAAAGFDLAVAGLRPAVTHALLERAWRVGAMTKHAQSPWLGAPAHVALQLHLEGRSILVGDSAERAALAMAPGMWPGARPGQRGTTIVLGHRNSAFRVLGELSPGEVIAVESLSGDRFEYRVAGAEVVRWNRSGLRPDTPEEVLALVTCWPIGSRERTPWRLIVKAERVR